MSAKLQQEPISVREYTQIIPSAEDRWLTRPEVAARMRVPVPTLCQWASQGKGPKYARFGRHCRYRLSDVIAWENAQFGDGVG